jgi:type I restriction enzyme S subunit
MKYPAYPKYKDSGVEWLGEVPEHWEIKRLKTSADYCVSNVDKVPAEDELPVRLCNYVNVYHNDYICPEIDLMDSTATVDEIRKFQVKDGDVLITKDSEDWRDIAVPALVVRSSPGIVCGYHLAIVRAHGDVLNGAFLFRSFQSSPVNKQFQVASTGVTRFGLPKGAIGEAWIALPPLSEQRAIAAFLDAQTSKLDTLIAKKRELIDKLKEKRAALITRTVTRGLPPDVAKAAGLDPQPKMKDSGVEWLGEVPEHWDMPPLYKRYYVELGKMLDEAKITGKYLVPYLRNTDVQWDRLNVDDLPEMDISPREYRRYTLVNGDLLVCEGGEVGRCAIFQGIDETIGFQKAIHRLRPRGKNECPRYLFYVICSAAKTGVFLAEGNPNTIIHLTGEKLRRYRFPCPPVSEQRDIATYLDRETAAIDALVAKVETAIERLQEYRAALITAAVTGQIDVREAVQ